MSPLLNYTTEIPAGKSYLEMQEMLSRHGVKAVLTEFDDDRRPLAISFTIPGRQGPMAYRLAADVDGVQRVLKQQAARGQLQPRYTRPGHAERVAWRVMKVWLQVTLTMIEVGNTTIEEAFMPYLMLPGGTTLYNAMVEGRWDPIRDRLSLPGGREMAAGGS